MLPRYLALQRTGLCLAELCAGKVWTGVVAAAAGSWGACLKSKAKTLPSEQPANTTLRAEDSERKKEKEGGRVNKYLDESSSHRCSWNVPRLPLRVPRTRPCLLL